MSERTNTFAEARWAGSTLSTSRREVDLDADVPREGEVIDGKYRVDRILGRGGMGVVVAATHIDLRQRVAIKFLLEPADEETLTRFLREARAAARLRSDSYDRAKTSIPAAISGRWASFSTSCSRAGSRSAPARSWSSWSRSMRSVRPPSKHCGAASREGSKT